MSNAHVQRYNALRDAALCSDARRLEAQIADLRARIGTDHFGETDDQAERVALLAHFATHLPPRDFEEIVHGLFDARANIAFIAKLYDVPCPPGYTL